MPAGLGRDRLELQRRDGALDEGDAGSGCGASEREITAMREQAGRARRRDGERQGPLLAEDLDREIAGGDVDERLRDEGQSLEGVAVALEAHLVLGAALEIFEREGGQAPLGDGAQFLDGQALSEIAPRMEPALHAFSSMSVP